MAQERVQRRLAAIVAADVVGYSGLMRDNEARTLRMLRHLRDGVLVPKIAIYGGRLFKTTGDGFLAEFSSAVDAVQFAADLQADLRKGEHSEDGVPALQLRIGINVGDVIVEDDDVYGDGVNVAARLEGITEPGGIYIARNVFNQVKDKLELNFDHMGEKKVKNIDEMISIYRVVLDNNDAQTIQHNYVTSSHDRRLPLYGAVTTVLIALIAALVWWQFWSPESPTSNADVPASETPSIAVLPFAYLGGDSGDDYFADGLTDDLITDLSNISGLFVIARNTVFAYKIRDIDIREAAKELGVRYVLNGSVRRAGDRLRINAQFIDSQTGGNLWADRFDSDASGIFATQDKMIRRIVDTLAVQLSPSEQQRLERLPTQNLEAYDYYLRAEQAAKSGFRPQLRHALQLYEKATALDRTFARAHASHARTAAYVLRHFYDDVLPAPVARKRAYEQASRALEIDPEGSLPFSVLAIVQTVDGQHDEALTSARKAIALSPNEGEAHAALSYVLTYGGNHGEAVEAIETAMRLNPRQSVGDRLVAGMAFMLNDQPERAIEILELARGESPNVDDIYVMLSAAYVLAGRPGPAETAAKEALRLGPALCAEVYRVVLGHFRSEQDLAKIIDAVASGGLPQWPFGFKASSGERLKAAEIETIAFGRTWQGRANRNRQAIMQISKNGGLAFRSSDHIFIGRAFTAGDMLCEQSEALSFGRPVCGPVYRRNDSPSEESLKYSYVNALKVFHFSPAD